MEDKIFKIIEAADRTTPLIEQLLKVWESSVKATHLFLSEDEIENIKKYVPQALKEMPYLMVSMNIWDLKFTKEQSMTNKAITIHYYI